MDTNIKFAAFAVAALMGMAAPMWAQCPVPTPSASASGWRVEAGDNGYVAESARYPDVTVRLDMHSPGRPEILFWRALPQYGGRVGVMRFFAGEPGTSYLVTLVDQVVVDLTTGREIGRGTYTEDCNPVEWTWHKNRVEVDDPGFGRQVFELP